MANAEMGIKIKSCAACRNENIGAKKLIDMNKAKRIVTLCYRCRDNYETAGYRLIFTGNHIKEPCEFCCSSFGLDYILEDRHHANKTM